MYAAAITAFAVLPPAAAQIRFEEIAGKAHLDFQLKNGASGRFRQPELMAGGVAAFDYNNDGCMDIFFTNGATIPGLRKTGPEFYNRLYRNNCDGTFTDVTAQAGVGGEGYSMAVATADFDNDGWCDIFVEGVNRNILYRNLGNGRFEDVTAKAGLSGIDLVLELPRHLRGQRLGVAGQGELVRLLARDAVVARHTFRGQPHRKIRIRIVLLEPGVDGNLDRKSVA